MPESPPQYCPTPRELDDLELINNGVLAPLTSFEGPGGLVTLRLPSSVAAQAMSAGAVEIVDPEGAPLAMVSVEHTYEDAPGWLGVAGEVVPTGHHEFGAFRRLYVSPSEVAQRYDARAVTVPVAAPLTHQDIEHIAKRAQGATVLLLALVGHGTPQGLSTTGLIRATLAAAQLMQDAHVVAVPLASRGDGVLDHELGQRVVEAYAPGPIVAVSGAGDLPAPIAEIVSFDVPDPLHQGLVVFFTGLSGSGKSTLARALHDTLLERGERTVTSLDGDVVRRNLSAGLTFSKEDRETNIRRIGWVAAEISRHGGVAVCSPIAPFDETRKHVRRMTEEAGGAFVLVHVATPLEECERRDRKGLYAKARRGEVPEFTGISSPYEEPQDAEIRVDTTGRSVEAALAEVLDYLRDQGFLSSAEPVDPAVVHAEEPE